MQGFGVVPRPTLAGEQDCRQAPSLRKPGSLSLRRGPGQCRAAEQRRRSLHLPTIKGARGGRWTSAEARLCPPPHTIRVVAVSGSYCPMLALAAPSCPVPPSMAPRIRRPWHSAPAHRLRALVGCSAPGKAGYGLQDGDGIWRCESLM